MKKRLILATLLAAATAMAADSAGRAQVVGGTLLSLPHNAKGTVRTADGDAFILETPASTLRVPYARINMVEYGQEVGRRVVLAWVVSPIFLLSKARRHFVTLGYTDEQGKQQAVVLLLDKHLVRPALAALEARTGLIVKYQDEEARKFRHG